MSKLEQMISRFGSAQVAAILDLLRSLMQSLIDDDLSDAVRLERAAHGLAGSAAMFGFDAVDEAARRLQDALRAGAPAGRLHRAAARACEEAQATMDTLLSSRAAA